LIRTDPTAFIHRSAAPSDRPLSLSLSLSLLVCGVSLVSPRLCSHWSSLHMRSVTIIGFGCVCSAVGWRNTYGSLDRLSLPTPFTFLAVTLSLSRLTHSSFGSSLEHILFPFRFHSPSKSSFPTLNRRRHLLTTSRSHSNLDLIHRFLITVNYL
jgi:hypothetical protein